MSNYLSIEPIPIAFRVVATKANLVWISKPFFSEAMTLRIEFYNTAEQMLDFLDVQLTVNDYQAKGADKWQRALVICQEQGIVVNSTEADVMPRAQTDEVFI